MSLANTIASTKALMADGQVIVYSDTDPAHVRQGRFAAILAGTPVCFSALTTDGQEFTVDLVTGSLYAAGQSWSPPAAPATPLRLIYYKHMHADSGSPAPVCEHFVVGWQTTTPAGRNLKCGLKVYPAQKRWEATEDI